MFIGIQIVDGESRKVAIGNTKSEIENLPCMDFDRIDEVEWAELYCGAIYTDRDELKTAKQSRVRIIRDELLQTEIDPVVTNPLRWAELSDDKKAEYADYRRYLLDYTETLAWWEQEPLTMDEWKQQK